MLDTNQERQLKVLLDAMNPPQQTDQPRDQKGRFTKNQEVFKSDWDKVTWIPTGDGHTFVRRRKSYYVLMDTLFLTGILVTVALFV